MHATKDYLDIPLLLSDYPVKHTFNLVPSLIDQLDSASQGMADPVSKLCMIHPQERTPSHEHALAQWILTLQHTQLADTPYLLQLRHTFELLAQARQPLLMLSDQEWINSLALLLWAWTGPVSRKRATICGYGHPSRDFIHADLETLLSEHRSIIAEIIPTLVHLEHCGKIEVSVSPYEHPILPLLISTNAALEQMPDAVVPQPSYTNISDAAWHVWNAVEKWYHYAGKKPSGIWPSEGGLSQATLPLMAAAGIRWTATDETVLANTLGTNMPLAKYFPRRFFTDAGPITVLFRDHALSDAIGFTYATWNHSDAVDDFMRRLRDTRELILTQTPQADHNKACITVILDGENCWEFYQGNGELFLRGLMEAIAADPLFETVTCSQAALHAVDVPPDTHISAGSWINGTFDIWIGSETQNLAWSLLKQADEAVVKAGNPPELRSVLRRLQASDYFWWYDTRHQAQHKSMFDGMFREGLQTIFNSCTVECPPMLFVPLQDYVMSISDSGQEYPVSFVQSTMHEADAITKSIRIETEGNWQRISFVFSREPANDEEVVFVITDRHGVARQLSCTNAENLFQSPLRDEGADRASRTIHRVYLHSSILWNIAVEEQRSAGSTARTAVTINLQKTQ